ncbi:MAG TPA: S8 family serine peptidase [Acidimicrobiales bacterium]|nr:S8 family serine peptidase [Acidimicrobiales bacterium]
MPKGAQERGSAGRRARKGPRAWFTALLAAVAVATPALAPAPASAGLLGLPTTRVIVMGTDIGSETNLVGSVAGTVLNNLPLVNGVVADVPSALVGVLGAVPGLSVVPDVPVSVADFGSSTTPTRAPAAVFPDATGASQLAASGVTGSGVGVAVLDTGITALPDFAGRLVDGVDLSGEGNPFHDGYGHGTFVAGLIAGNGASSGGQYVGEAPDANLISVKVAGSSGKTDLAAVILGVGWVVDHQATDHISVLNMSLGAQPFTSTVINPLDIAVEAAWRHGVAVVASAGNAGPFNGTILSPGDDPLVITVGALDDGGTAATGDDTMTAFSSVGPTNPDGWFKPDLVASGRSVVSLRAAGSTVDRNYPSARIGSANFVGSGTSFSTAITSGAAALVIQAGSIAGQPDALKARLLGGATAGPIGNPFVDGHGSLNAYWAAMAGNVSLHQTTPFLPTLPGATVSLATTWAASAWNGGAWNGSVWNGGAWNGGAWNGGAWNGGAWNGGAWNGAAWNGGAWNGSAWN